MVVFMTEFTDLFGPWLEKLARITPNVLRATNFEQVYGMVKAGEIERIAIDTMVFNFSGSPFNRTRGQFAAERIHETHPSIPILVWDGRACHVKGDDPKLDHIAFSGTPYPVKNANEYVECNRSDSWFCRKPQIEILYRRIVHIHVAIANIRDSGMKRH